VGIARRNANHAGLEGCAVLGQLDRKRRHSFHPAHETVHEVGVNVLDDEHGRTKSGETREHDRQGCGSSCRGPDRDDRATAGGLGSRRGRCASRDASGAGVPDDRDVLEGTNPLAHGLLRRRVPDARLG
jgi:hypothetical protein